MNNNVTLELPEAIILCGGKGERLRPITNDTPKPLVKLDDHPILHYVIEHLVKFNIKNINIASGFKSNVINKYFSKTNYDASIKIHDSGDVDIIKRIQDIFVTVQKDVIVLYGDTIANVDIKITTNKKLSCLVVTALVKSIGKTGVEMEALTAVSISCLTIYDMCKSLDKNIFIDKIRLISKKGGKSDFLND